MMMKASERNNKSEHMRESGGGDGTRNHRQMRIFPAGAAVACSRGGKARRWRGRYRRHCAVTMPSTIINQSSDRNQL